MFRLRFSRKTAWILVAGIATIGLVAFGLLQPQARAGEPTGDDLAGMGIRHGVVPNTFRPTIPKEQALAVAKARVVPRLGEQDTDGKVEVALVLFSNDQYYTENERGERTYHYQDIPAWVVTFHDIKFPLRAIRGGSMRYNTEVNVVIDATTGGYLESYSYR